MQASSHRGCSSLLSTGALFSAMLFLVLFDSIEHKGHCITTLISSLSSSVSAGSRGRQISAVVRLLVRAHSADSPQVQRIASGSTTQQLLRTLAARLRDTRHNCPPRLAAGRRGKKRKHRPSSSRLGAHHRRRERSEVAKPDVRPDGRAKSRRPAHWLAVFCLQPRGDLGAILVGLAHS